jgi:hypothetical protein
MIAHQEVLRQMERQSQDLKAIIAQTRRGGELVPVHPIMDMTCYDYNILYDFLSMALEFFVVWT